MTVSETYTAIGDAIRRQYGTTDKYSLGDMPKMIDSLHVTNLLDEGQFYDSSIDTVNEKKLNGLNLSDWEKLTGMTVILSFDVIWSGYDLSKENSHRTGFEYGIKFKNSPELWLGAWLYPKSSSGNKHMCFSYTLPNDEVTNIEEGSYFNQINSDAVVKATNFKAVVNPLGGVVPANLFEGKFTFDPTYVNQYGNLYQFNVTKITSDYHYASMIFITNRVQAKENQSYKLKFKARGNGQIWSYVYGNNYQETYVDNGHPWQLTNQWKDYEQLFPVDSIPVKNGGLLVDIRTLNPVQGEIADIEFIPA